MATAHQWETTTQWRVLHIGVAPPRCGPLGRRFLHYPIWGVPGVFARVCPASHQHHHVWQSHFQQRKLATLTCVIPSTRPTLT